MTQEDVQPHPRKKKVNLTVTISPYIYDWMTVKIKEEVYTSYSDAVSAALYETKGREEGRAEEGINKETAIEEIKKVSLDAVTAIKKAAVSNENSTVLLLNLLTTHEELIEEINNQIRIQRSRRTDNSNID